MEYLLNMLKGSVIMFALPLIFNDSYQVTSDRQCGLRYNAVISKNQGETVEMPCILATTLQEGQLVIWRNGIGDRLSECAPRTCSNILPHAPERVRIITDHKHNFTLSIINVQVDDSLTYHCDFYSSKSSTGSCEATAIALDVTTKDYVQTVSTFPLAPSKEVGSMNNATVSPVNTNLAGETTYSSITNTIGSPFDNTTSKNSSISTTDGASVKAKANPVSNLTSTSSTVTVATSDVNVTLSDIYASLSNCYTGKHARAETFFFWIGVLTTLLTLTLLVVTCCLIIKTCAMCFRRRKNSRRRFVTDKSNSVEMLFIGRGDCVDGDNENQRKTLKTTPQSRNDAGNNVVNSPDPQLHFLPDLEPMTMTMASTHIHGDSNEFSQTRLKDYLCYPTMEVESKVPPSHNSQEKLHTFNGKHPASGSTRRLGLKYMWSGEQRDKKDRRSPFPLKIKRTYFSPLHPLEPKDFVSSGRKSAFDDDLFSPHFDDLKGHTYMDVYDQDNPFPNMHLCKIGYHTSLGPSRGQDAVRHLPVLSDSMTPPSNERDMDRHIWYTREGDGKLRTSSNNFKTSTLSANSSSFTQRWQERKARTDINFPTPPPLPASRHENRD